jgi:NAD(P)-dependent dehydrogenase (short-subunit alcohol dehydrogenase family)
VTVALISGGGTGIGRATARELARAGTSVTICGRRPEPLEAVRAELEAAGTECLAVPADIREPEQVDFVVDQTLERFGRIDILVNNAAFQRTYEALADIPDEEWSYTFRTNTEAMFHLAKAAVPHMRPGSSIINTTSIQSDKPSPMLLAYASTKGAVSNFTAGLAQMLGSRGIRVNAVAPGPIWTPLIPSTMPDKKVKSFGQDTPLGRAGQPKELAGIYVLLASDEGSYMTGGIHAVTGGTPLL